MKELFNERSFLEKHKNILYYGESELGVEYIIYNRGYFKKYTFKEDGSYSENIISFSEYFKLKCKRHNFMLTVSRIIYLDVLSVLLLLFIIKGSLIENIHIIFGLSIYLVVHSRNYIVRVLKFIITSFLLLLLGVLCVELYHFSDISRVILFLGVSLGVLCNALATNIILNISDLYYSLKSEFPC